FLKQARRFRQALDRDQFEADAYLVLGEVERCRRHDRLVVAVARNRNTQDTRAFKIIDCRGGGSDDSQASDDRSEYETEHPTLFHRSPRVATIDLAGTASPNPSRLIEQAGLLGSRAIISGDRHASAGHERR